MRPAARLMGSVELLELRRVEWDLTGFEGRRLMERLAARRSDRLAANDNSPDAEQQGPVSHQLPLDLLDDGPSRKNRRKHRVRP